jgi:hypothetical protein
VEMLRASATVRDPGLHHYPDRPEQMIAVAM